MIRNENCKNVWEVVENEEAGQQIAEPFYTLTSISSLDTKLFSV